MTDLRVERLIREHVRKIIAEDGGDFGGFGGYGGWGDLSGGMRGGWGYGYGIGKDLGKFLDPFIDVFKTAVGSTKELSLKAQQLVSTAFVAATTIVVPALSDNYGEIFKQYKSELNKVKQEYKEVYQRTWDAFKNDDFLVSAFFYSPSSLLTSYAATQAPETTIKILSILSGGKLDSLLGKIKDKLSSGVSMPKAPTRKSSVRGRDLFSYAWMEHVIREEAKEDKRLEKVLANPKLVNAAVSGQYAQRMMQDTRKIVDATLSAAYEHVKNVASAKSIADIEKLLGQRLPAKVTKPINKMKQNERARAEATFIKGLKEPTKAGVVKDLEAKAKATMNAGVPGDSPYIQAIRSTISKIKQL